MSGKWFWAVRQNQMDPAEFDAEIEAQFQFEEFSRYLGETVTDLEALRADYDAVYVATGADGADFGLKWTRTAHLQPGHRAFSLEVP